MESSDHGDAGSQNDDDADSAASLGEGDFDKYLAELSNNSGGGVAGSGGDSDAGGTACAIDMQAMRLLSSLHFWQSHRATATCRKGLARFSDDCSAMQAVERRWNWIWTSTCRLQHPGIMRMLMTRGQGTQMPRTVRAEMAPWHELASISMPQNRQCPHQRGRIKVAVQ